mmetsp:Transcript_4271/g.11652  ORF Transcript_4271/g.11652 Transcript_4271/m.11652 type:complete len:312 (+) Transcript_4271:173-1108(+)|eukprot:CAMPEP_0168740688 /NCGR_PEP_ID=MMETSP0724-20121128/12118_1 /TAXON_ID=265536 /ORGANISM="Amphiprora sp., Strain CCMP467" /LENGTH=311 /DNA_ID=CAMNT_0008788151 /DNA_START=113 /DNA_END=1048 /DNA_ORIENTATION=-
MAPLHRHESNNMMLSRPSRMMPLLILLTATLLMGSVSAYPVIVAVEDEDNEDAPRCLQFSIPEDDDAHVVIMALPDTHMWPDEKTADAVESWYVEQIYKMTKLKSEHDIIPKKLPDDVPSEVATPMSEFLKDHHGGPAPIKISVSITDDDEEDAHDYKAKFFTPLVFNHIRHRHGADEEDEDNYEGVKICFAHKPMDEDEEDDTGLYMVFDMLLVSEEVSDLDPKSEDPGFQKHEHITPLEESLDESISAARSVLKEMRHMEQREQRMKETADGINARVHYFSYVSIAILFGVTYIQVGYLKRYFKKKKLM